MKFLMITLVLLSSTVKAEGIWQDHVLPTLDRAFDKTGATFLISGASLAALMQEQDETNLSSVQSSINLSNDLDQLGDFMGTGVFGLLISAGQYYFDDKSKATAHFETIIYTGLTTAILKGTFNRTRPNGGNHSMPSGHTSTIFATATSLTYSYGWKGAAIGYPLAVLTVLQRMDSSSHWPSDIVAGATLGVFWARAVHDHKLKNITPVVSSDRIGLYYQASF